MWCLWFSGVRSFYMEGIVVFMKKHYDSVQDLLHDLGYGWQSHSLTFTRRSDGKEQVIPWSDVVGRTVANFKASCKVPELLQPAIPEEEATVPQHP